MRPNSRPCFPEIPSQMMKQEESRTERKAFKNWFDGEALRRIADQFSATSRRFDRGKFLQLGAEGLEDLEFNGRVGHIARALRKSLPVEIPDALEILRESLPEEQADCDSVTDGWLQWPLGRWIADFGTGHPDEAIPAMIELTKRFSSEFAVRPFVERYPETIFPLFEELAGHPNAHVRRWCSEGVRPRLPWGKKLHRLIEDPSPILPILEKLRDDEELYVRRSVANNLNDIARDHPDLVVGICRRWWKGAAEDRRRLIRHALRSLLKDGHPGALSVLGFPPPDRISASLDVFPSSVAVGESVTLEATVHNDSSEDVPLMVDYAVHFLRKGGKISDKVFKWKTLELVAGERRSLEKRHSLKETTIRALYPGVHRIELQINGVRVAETEFTLR